MGSPAPLRRAGRASPTRSLPALLALALCCALAAGAATPHGAGAAAPPNFLVIQTDDQVRSDLTATYTDPATGAQLAVMPNTLSLIAAQGLSFNRYYVSNPLCCPSRTTLLTGRYSHNNGVLTNFYPSGGYYKFDQQNNLAVWLHRAGYRTIHIGKFLNEYGTHDPTEEPPGWSDWHSIIGADPLPYYGFELNDNGKVTGPYGDDTYAQKDPSGCPDDPPILMQCNYATDVLDRDALAAIGNVPAGQPFYLQVDYTAPHGDLNPPAGPEPAVRDIGTLAGARAPRVPGFNERDVSDKPPFIRRDHRLTAGEISAIDQRYQARLESLRSVDQGIGQIIDRLSASGQLANTYIFFTSDNGFFQGEHRFDASKFLAYEPSNHLPLLLRGPGIPAGATSNELVGNMDITPTVLQLSGAQATIDPDGRSLLKYAENPRLKSKRPILLEGFTGSTAEGASSGTPSQAVASVKASPRDYEGIVFGPYKYIQYRGGAKELYDLSSDPYELHSRASDPRYRLIKAWLATRLARLEVCAGAGCRRPLTGRVPKVLAAKANG